MACNPNRLNCSPDDIFAASAIPACSVLVDPSVLQAEQLVYDNSFHELINNFGVEVNYYINTFNLSAADLLYGEQPTAIFYGPMSLMMYVELAENAVQLSKFGFSSDDSFTGYLHIASFYESVSGKQFYTLDSNGDIITFSNYDHLLGVDFRLEYAYSINGQSIEPKTGDLIELIDLGCDRPNGRGSKIFEVTERMDQDVSGKLNPLLGHYVYRLRAKRYEYSFEPNAPKENVNEQIFENTFNGVLSTNVLDAYYNDSISDTKTYPGDIDITSKTKVLDMDVDNTDIYGGYY